MNALAMPQFRHRNFRAPLQARRGFSLRSEIFCGWPVSPAGSKRVPYPLIRLLYFDDSVLVETAFLGSLPSSYMFTLSGLTSPAV